MRFLTPLIATVFACAATSAFAQEPPPPPPPPQASASVDPGMTKAQVVERLGKPATERTRGTFTYLFYVNGMEQRVGMSDIVVLDDDRVVDAIFRSSRRTYTGSSSSPRAIPPQEAARVNRSGTPPDTTTSR